MISKKFLFVLLLIFSCAFIFAQEQLHHDKQYYTAPDGKFYYSKYQKAYLFISTSPDENAKKYRLESPTSPQYTNPMYFAYEGLNRLWSPSCVDTVTKKVVYPQKNINFEVYADGKAPYSKSRFYDAKRYRTSKATYYATNVKLDLSASDALSGVQDIYFSVNGSDYKKYISTLNFEGVKTSEYTLKYYAVDNVGNVEKPKTKNFFVDITPPRVRYVLYGVQEGETVLSEDSYIVLKATDDLSGVNKMYYSVDKEPFKLFTGRIDLGKFQGGYHSLDYYAVDKVGNSSRKRKTQELDASVIDFSEFIVDKKGPEVNMEFNGVKYEGKHLYINGKTKIHFNSSDKESGTAFVFFGIDKPVRTDTFEQEFVLDVKPGLHRINYSAMDNLKNTSKTQSQLVYFDNVAPTTSIDYKWPVFFNRDTLFISKKTKIVLYPRDDGAGLKTTRIAIDGKEFEAYNGQFTISEPGYHKIRFQSVDNVENEEQIKESEFVVDDTPPEIYANFSVKPIGKEKKRGTEYPVYPPYTRIYLGATDKYTGNEKIFYSINGGRKKEYTSAGSIADSNLLTKEGFYKVKISAVDKLGNEAEKTEKFFIRKK